MSRKATTAINLKAHGPTGSSLVGSECRGEDNVLVPYLEKVVGGLAHGQTHYKTPYKTPYKTHEPGRSEHDEQRPSSK